MKSAGLQKLAANTIARLWVQRYNPYLRPFLKQAIKDAQLWKKRRNG